MTATPITDDQVTTVQQDGDSSDELVIEELLIEEISIDGMCGVY